MPALFAFWARQIWHVAARLGGLLRASYQWRGGPRSWRASHPHAGCEARSSGSKQPLQRAIGDRLREAALIWHVTARLCGLLRASYQLRNGPRSWRASHPHAGCEARSSGSKQPLRRAIGDRLRAAALIWHVTARLCGLLRASYQLRCSSRFWRASYPHAGCEARSSGSKQPLRRAIGDRLREAALIWHVTARLCGLLRASYQLRCSSRFWRASCPRTGWEARRIGSKQPLLRAIGDRLKAAASTCQMKPAQSRCCVPYGQNADNLRA
jgi:hypothetical protein